MPAFPTLLGASGILGNGSPLTVAGAASDWNDVPTEFPFGPQKDTKPLQLREFALPVQVKFREVAALCRCLLVIAGDLN